MISEKVNNGRIQEAYSVGSVTNKDLKDAYTATISKSVSFKSKNIPAESDEK